MLRRGPARRIADRLEMSAKHPHAKVRFRPLADLRCSAGQRRCQCQASFTAPSDATTPLCLESTDVTSFHGCARRRAWPWRNYRADYACFRDPARHWRRKSRQRSTVRIYDPLVHSNRSRCFQRSRSCSLSGSGDPALPRAQFVQHLLLFGRKQRSDCFAPRDCRSNSSEVRKPHIHNLRSERSNKPCGLPRVRLSAGNRFRHLSLTTLAPAKGDPYGGDDLREVPAVTPLCGGPERGTIERRLVMNTANCAFSAGFGGRSPWLASFHQLRFFS